MAFLVPQIFKAYDQRQKRLDDLNNTLQENLSGARVVKAFVREDLENERFEKRAAAMREPAYQAAFRVALLNPLLAAIAQVAIVFSIWIGADQIFSGVRSDFRRTGQLHAVSVAGGGAAGRAGHRGPLPAARRHLGQPRL